MKILKRLFVVILFLFSCFVIIKYFTAFNNKNILSLKNYDQDISHWIKKSEKDFNVDLMPEKVQEIRLQELFTHYYGEKSPWNKNYINKVLQHKIKDTELDKIKKFNNKIHSTDKAGFGMNYKPYDIKWLNKIKSNINMSQFDNLNFSKANFAISTSNLQGRLLPTNDVFFYDHRKAGEGYPFDNLQASSVWAGTPLYILGESKDKAWVLVVNPNFIAWVESKSIAKVEEDFIDQWIKAAKNKLVAITNVDIPVVDKSNNFAFSGYIGMMFPKNSNNEILVPFKNANNIAVIKYAKLNPDSFTDIPLKATPHNFVKLLQKLQNRQYGWGGMGFYNDCASELKNIFLTFGVWIPIHSSEQVNVKRYNIVVKNLSALSINKRLEYLAKNGHKFMTIIYINGHVMLYLGNYIDPVSGKDVILTYQNLWGLKVKRSLFHSEGRAIVGGSVIFPLMDSYPEGENLAAQSSKPLFILGFLDQVTKKNSTDEIDITYLTSP